MDTIQKFYTDIRKVVKHGRTQDGSYSSDTVCTEIAQRFSNLFADLGSLPESIAEYWLQNRILKSAAVGSEPSEQNLLWLISAADILNGNPPDEGESVFTAEDWKELFNLVNAEAEDLPIDTLTDLMSLFMSKKLL
ncbi:hypothetical protein V1L52_03280 [Treponema sp. HNW]|uniref:hypothetical protein n=1 Tax=Treponema sp. HNW TaxID=3116654 RepID=UPI003D10ACA9